MLPNYSKYTSTYTLFSVKYCFTFLDGTYFFKFVFNKCLTYM